MMITKVKVEKQTERGSKIVRYTEYRLFNLIPIFKTNVRAISND